MATTWFGKQVSKWQGVALACCLIFSISCIACGIAGDEHQAKASNVTTPADNSQWVGPGFSGTWHDPARQGEGFVLEILDNGKALAVWFTYPPPGSPAKQAWVIAQEGVVERNRIRFSNALTTRGAKFGPIFDPASVQILPWGSLDFEFLSCNSLRVSYSGPSGWGSGVSNLERLSILGELSCTGKSHIGSAGARTITGLKQRSGSWFDPSHSGEGWMFQELQDGRAVGFWFTYDAQGEQAWTIGFAEQAGANMRMDNVLRPIGGRFGANFDPSAIVVQPWGKYQVEFTSCASGTLNYQSSQPEFASGTLKPTRLTQLSGAVCLDTTPSLPNAPVWSQGAVMPHPVSETPAAGSGDKIYLAGGYRSGTSAVRDFSQYEISTNTWSELSKLPYARDHAMAIEFEGQIFVFGGNQSDASDNSPGWRFNPPQNSWTPLPPIISGVASGSARLGGKLYFGSVEGIITELDPRTLIARSLPMETAVMRDHSQLLAFQGEIWLLGGRDSTAETSLVSIFDPASETWRVGPPMRAARGGFAAASDEKMIVLTGGELIYSGRRVVASSEVLLAGSQSFATLPNLPVPVHGMGGVLRDRTFIVLGGSKRAGIAVNSGEVQVLRWSQ